MLCALMLCDKGIASGDVYQEGADGGDDEPSPEVRPYVAVVLEMLKYGVVPAVQAEVFQHKQRRRLQVPLCGRAMYECGCWGCVCA